VRAIYVARPTFSPNNYQQMVGRGLRGKLNGGTERCLIVNVRDNWTIYGDKLAFLEFEHLWKPDRGE
jgi:superfamily II DNA or RNA helicase